MLVLVKTMTNNKNNSENKAKKSTKLAVKAGVKTRTIQVDYLARVEGEGALYIEFDDQNVTDVKLKLFEPPRFFEAFLKGRDFSEAPDITARICGICPVAYQMSAVNAMEDAMNMQVPAHIHQLRRLLYCGEWIESHALHVYMLHTPDFLGFDDAIQMSKQHPDIIKDGLLIKKMGNKIIKLFGGREVHPINVKVGGFYKLPNQEDIKKLIEDLKPVRDKAFAAIAWFAGLDYPYFAMDYEYVALSHPEEYAMARGRLVSTKGLDIEAKQFEQHIEEFQVPHSTALHARLKARDNYLVGPMARYNINRNNLSKLTLEAANSIKFEQQCHNPFRSIIIRNLEILYAYDEAIRILSNINDDLSPNVACAPCNATGYGITEAPRGSLYHRYEIDSNGDIVEAKIIPPTSQNQLTIEKDLANLVKQHIKLPKDKLTWRCEQAIRNYDPCISCSTHFLRVHFNER